MIDDLRLAPAMRETLEQLLLEAFDEPGLERLARRLDIELAQIAEGPRRQVVARLLEEVGRQGRGRAFIRMARRANPTHRRLNELLGLLIPRRFTGEQLSELVRLLQGAALPWPVVERQFWLSLPDTWGMPAEDGLQDEAERLADRVEVLSELAGNSLRGQVPPLLEFALRLHRCLEAGGVSERLGRWLQGTALVLGLEPRALEAHGHRLVHELCLLVKLERVTVEGFQVEAWLSDDPSRPPRAIFQEEQPRTLGELPAVLRRLWRQRELLAPLKELGESKLTIEFLLPRELLLHPVENWCILPGAPIGTRYQVVVRSLERAYAEVRPPLEAELEELSFATVPWNDKWRALSGPARVPPRPVWVCQSADHQCNRFLADLARPEVVCLALTLAPPQLSELTLRELIHHCLVSGMPIALWARKPRGDGAELRALFERLLRELNALPGEVRQARLDGFSSEDEAHPGNHLTLLWDDPNRLPADARPGSDYGAPVAVGAKG